MLKQVLKWIFIVLVTLIVGGGLGVYIYKDRIIRQVIVEVNSHLAVPIEVTKVDIDFLHGFPNIAVAFNGIRLPADAPVPLLEAEKLYTIINPFALLRGELNIDRLELVKASLHIVIDQNNKSNIATLFKSTAASDSDTLSADSPISLNSILLKEVEVDFINNFTGSDGKWQIPKLEGRLVVIEGVYSSEVEGSVNFLTMKTRNWQATNERNIRLDLLIGYDSKTEELTINESAVKYGGAGTKVSGTVNFSEIAKKVALNIEGDNITFDIFASFLPAKYASIFSKYQSSGQIDFSATLNGEISAYKYPKLNATVSLSDVDLVDKDFNANINKLMLKANLTLPDIGNLSTGTVEIINGQGLLEDLPFSFDLTVNNLLKPRFRGKFDGNLSAKWLLGAARYPYHETGNGNLDIVITAEGDYANTNPKEQLKLGGHFDLDDISFQYSEDIKLEKLGGIVQFKGNDISLSNINIEWMDSDVTINGSINDLDLSNQEDQIILLRSDLRSNTLHIEDVVSLIKEAPAIQPIDSSSSFKPQFDIELLCNIENLKFRRSHSQQVSGEVSFAEGVLEVVDLNGKSMGGLVKLNGRMKQLNTRDIYIEARAQTKRVNIDSLFYVFNNFRQEFITEKNLKGELFADVSGSMFFDSTWRFRSQLLYVDAKLGLMGGQLNNFEPIMALSSYIDDKDDNLSQLQFSDLVNEVRIRKDTIFIPEMSIQTNVRNIALGGYHTLDQHINYQLAVPIIDERVDKDEAFGAVQKSSKGSPNLLFRIKGTATDYKVNYDLLRATGNVLKLLDITKIFKKMEEVPIDSSFLEDEEFDWED